MTVAEIYKPVNIITGALVAIACPNADQSGIRVLLGIHIIHHDHNTTFSKHLLNYL